MNRCPITYQICDDHQYSEKGLKLLNPKLKHLRDFPFTAKEQLELALQQASKISIQGIQPKFSTRLDVAENEFVVVEQGGTFIFKPPHQIYPELPQNEDLTMRLAAAIGLEVPLHGMIYNKDRSLTYFIRRFDRLPNGHKLAVEDFSQLMGLSRDTKYESSMEKLIPIIEKHCTFPALEKLKLFRLTVFNFLVGNEDSHLKNFSLIRREDKVEFSPVYDLLNSTIVLKTQEETALSLHGKKSKLNRSDLVDYFGKERLGLAEKVLEEEIQHLVQAVPTWETTIKQSFLSQPLQEKYVILLHQRIDRLNP
jgi:serine/threonine-protein kinase HipA